MPSRHDRRAEKAAKLPVLPKAKNLSGTDANCGNCARRANAAAWAFNVHIAREPAKAEGKVLCLAQPHPVEKESWGWCQFHAPRSTDKGDPSTPAPLAKAAT